MCELQKVVKNYSESQRSSNAYSTKKNVMLGITNISNPESEEEVHEKKTLREILSEIPLFFNAIMMAWTNPDF